MCDTNGCPEKNRLDQAVPFRMRSRHQFRAAQNSPPELEVGFQSSPISVATLGCSYPHPAHSLRFDTG